MVAVATAIPHDLFRRLAAFDHLYDVSMNKGEAPLETFTILTGPANELVTAMHHRMPIIVRPELFEMWLDPACEDYSALAPVLEPFPIADMEAFRVRTKVNSPRNDVPSLIEPVAAL